MKRRIESWSPLAVSLLVLIASFCLYPSVDVAEEPVKEALNSAITMASILAGFTGTLVSIILGTESRRSMKWIADVGDLPRLITFTYRTILSNILLASSSFVGQILDISSTQWEYDRICKAVWIGLFSYCIFSFLRVAGILLEILRDPN